MTVLLPERPPVCLTLPLNSLEELIINNARDVNRKRYNRKLWIG